MRYGAESGDEGFGRDEQRLLQGELAGHGGVSNAIAAARTAALLSRESSSCG